MQKVIIYYAIYKEPPMPYNPIKIDRQNLSMIGVNFISINNFDAAVNALRSVMFEYQPGVANV